MDGERTTAATGDRRPLTLTRRELEELRRAGRAVEIQVLGLATIAPDVRPELAPGDDLVVEVLGAFRASPAVKAALASRTARPADTRRPP